jgi:hypothetical protein
VQEVAIAERERVRAHLFAAELRARSVPPAGLSHVQQLTRALLLDALDEYRAEGTFPQNRHCTEPVPTFADDFGTRCAVAHMLELGGAGEIVERVR